MAQIKLTQGTSSHKLIAIAGIKVPKERERELGDIHGLADSIKARGLIHDIAVTPDNTIVVGYRRLTALKMLGRTHASCKVCHTAADILEAKLIERDENTQRKDYSPSEAVAKGQEIEALLAPQAKERQLAFADSEEATGPVAAIAAQAVGMGVTSYKEAKTVVEAAKQNPKANGHLVDKMDKTGNVHAAFKAIKKELEDYPEGLIEAFVKAHKKWKILASETQLIAFAKFDADTQEELFKSILAGKQTLSNAIETGCVPEFTIDKTIGFRNTKIEKACKDITKMVESRIKELADEDPWISYQGRGDAALAKVKSMCEILRTIKCTEVCPKCEGGCPVCLGTGRLPKAVLQTLG